MCLCCSPDWPLTAAGLVRLQDLVRAPPELDMEVYIRQALPEEYRDVLREIKNKDIQNIVVDTKPENIQLFLRSVRLGHVSAF